MSVKAKCKWCGELFIKEQNRQMYCKVDCRQYARQEQNRAHRLNYYYKYKETMGEEKKYGLGTGFLSTNRNKNFENELTMIQNEIKRLKIRN